MKRKILISLLGSALCAGSFILGFLLSKKKYNPKQIDGDIYIDYLDDPKHPSMYSQLDPRIFNNTSGYVVIRITHIRK